MRSSKNLFCFRCREVVFRENIMPRCLAFLLCLLSLSFASQTREELVHNACAAANACLSTILPGCLEEDLAPISGIEYDAEFCAPFLDLRNRGLDLNSPVTAEMFGHLGERYRVNYTNEGYLPVTGDMMSYLFDHLPFTTVLVNAFQGTAYKIHYNSQNQRLFSGDNGGHLYGDFYWVLQDSAGMYKGFRDVFYGSGRCQILRWNLRGIAIAFLDMYPMGNKVRYKFVAVVFPANAILNSLMQMGFFRSVVDDKMSEIINNISESSKRYAAGEHTPVDTCSLLKKPPYSKQIAEFEQVAEGKLHWTVGDALQKKLDESRKKRPIFVTETPMIFKKINTSKP